jgi:hypothetical protein
MQTRGLGPLFCTGARKFCSFMIMGVKGIRTQEKWYYSSIILYQQMKKYVQPGSDVIYKHFLLKNNGSARSFKMQYVEALEKNMSKY